MYSERRRDLKGSFTIEASIIMPIIIMIIVMLIYVSFFIYDRCVISQKTYIAAFRGSQFEEELVKDSIGIEDYIKQEGNALFQQKLLAAGSVDMEVRKDHKKIIVSSQTSVKIPFKRFLKNRGFVSGWEIAEEKEVSVIREIDIIRTCNKWKKRLEKEKGK